MNDLSIQQQASPAVLDAAPELDDFSTLLQKEFKPKSERARPRSQG